MSLDAPKAPEKKEGGEENQDDNLRRERKKKIEGGRGEETFLLVN